MIVVFLLAVLLLLAQLRVTNQEGFNSTLFAIAEQSLAPPRLQEVSTGGGEGEETSILDNLPQPSQYQFLSDKLREYFREDSHRILQESIKKYPSATFQAIALKYLDSQSWQAIAETFGAPKSNLSTFSTFYYRQLEKLAPEIKKHLQE